MEERKPDLNKLVKDQEPTEEERVERYNKIILDLQCKNGWSPRKAKRAHAVMQRKFVNSFLKQGKARQNKMRSLGNVVDVEAIEE
jgi:hypothetical protein